MTKVHWLAAAAAIAFLTPLALHAREAGAPKPAPLSALVRQVDIPYEQFTLDNGLRVIVHTDRKAPIVAVSVWYGVGSSDEPAGKTGFAHLFEHLMFNGSGNYDGEFFIPLEEVGATGYNGTTNVDRTNYFQNVPTPALDLALFLEADRMGNLLPAVTQAKLDNQRGVVQNEKRQGDNQPYGLFRYALSEGLYPQGHPYHHSTIGSMADLDAATLEDAQAWFRQFYGPNNAVLVLAGDIDAKTARPLVEKYFGAIPRGPSVAEPAGGVPDRSDDTREALKDRVPVPRLYFTWAVPGRLSRELVDLDVAATILAGGQSSRLHNALVRDEQLAVGVSGFTFENQLSSSIIITVDVKPGTDVAKAEARALELIEAFIAEGPSKDEVERVALRTVAGTIRGLEQIGGFGGKAVALAEGALYADDPGFFKRQLSWYARATPASVRRAAKAWMSDGRNTVLIEPGERGERELALAGVASQRTPPEEKPAALSPDRSKLPPVTAQPALEFPAIERATLSNGVQVTFARRAAVPVVTVLASFDAGAAADDKSKPGAQLLTLNVMREGTAARTGPQIVEELERLGGALFTGFDSDSTSVGVSALKPNLRATLDVFADVLRNPTFPQGEVDRVRNIQLSQIAQEENSPAGLARRELIPLAFGPDHPYGVVSALGTREAVTGLGRDDLTAFHARWLRPDNMQVFLVGDTTLAEALPMLEATLGSWRAPDGVAKGEKRFAPPAPTGQGRVLLIDRPNSPQSVILAGKPLAVKGADDPLALRLANTVLGGAFTSRINSDLRETKGWSYGAGSGVSQGRHDLVYTVSAPVQADRTADSIVALKENITAFQGERPVTAEELSRAINNNTLSLPGAFETANAVLGAIASNATLGRPDDYQTTLAARTRALSASDVVEASKIVDVDQLIWVVVGDAAVVEPQLAALGMPFEVRRAGAVAGGAAVGAGSPAAN